jgi:hypothetical protein
MQREENKMEMTTIKTTAKKTTQPLSTMSQHQML